MSTHLRRTLSAEGLSKTNVTVTLPTGSSELRVVWQTLSGTERELRVPYSTIARAEADLKDFLPAALDMSSGDERPRQMQAQADRPRQITGFHFDVC